MARRGAFVVGLVLWVALSAHTQSIRISEVLANPRHDKGGQRAGEFVELVNIGDASVDLLGWTIADAHVADEILPFAEGGPTQLQPQSFAVILDPDNEGQYDIPPDVLLLRPANSAIGNGLSLRDIVVLSDPAGEQVDIHTPPMSARNGTSFERVDFSGPDEAANWLLCSSDNGTTIGGPTGPRRKEQLIAPENQDVEGVIVFNEVLFRPKVDAPEWIEVHNRAEVAVTMMGWTLSDARGQAVDVPVGTIPAKGYTILTGNAADFRAEHPDTPSATLVVEMPLPALDNAGDTLMLGVGPELVLDRIAYASYDADRGQSLERRDPKLPSDRLDNWLLSVHLAGSTPGTGNSVEHKTGPEPLIQATPSPFEPGTDTVELRYEAPTSARVTLRVYDARGAVVRTLLEDTPNAGRQTIAWDGADEDDEPVTPGVYTIVLVTMVDRRPRAASVAVVAGKP